MWLILFVLSLVGLGLEKGDLTLKGLTEIKSADHVYIENYTSFPYELDFPAIPLEREQVESDFLLIKAIHKKVVLLVPGDPLFATTHTSLIFEARRKGVDVQVIHAPSIINAVLRTGLSPYKFGRIVTLSKAYDSDKEKIERNQKIGLHTLCLINPLTPIKDALGVLKEMGFSGKMLVGEKLGTSDERFWYNDLEILLDEKYGKPPHIIIIPSKLHFFEEDFMKMVSSLHK